MTKAELDHELAERIFENTVQPRDLEDRMEAELRAADARDRLESTFGRWMTAMKKLDATSAAIKAKGELP
jgi:hypothetical protein